MIVVPEFFIRVGFPLRMNDILEDYGPDLYSSAGSWLVSPTTPTATSGNPINTKTGVRTDLDKRIIKFLDDKTAPWYNQGRISNEVQSGILRLLAYAVLQKRDFGGKERKIFTNRADFLEGRIYVVVGKKIVRTGIYDQARLKGRNNLILLVRNEKLGVQDWIEAKNVRLLKKPELALLNEL